MDDYRVMVGFLDHHKTMRLRRRLGPGAVETLLRLFEFCTVTVSRRSGDLSGMDAEAVADALRYPGDPAELVGALTECGWLDGDPGVWRVHDWAETNPYVANWQQRSAAARRAANRRWGSRGHADRMPTALPIDTSGNAPDPDPDPYPDPDPVPKPAQRVRPIPLAVEGVDPRVSEVVELYCARYPRQRAQAEHPETRRLIRARLSDGYSPADIGQGIEGNARSEWHQARGYNSLAKMLETPAKLDEWITRASKGSASDKTHTTAAAIGDFLKGAADEN